MNDFLDFLSSRYSVRSFSDEKLNGDEINMVLKAALLSPTALNNQPFKIHVIKSAQALNKLQECKPQHYNESIAFIITYNKNQCWYKPEDQTCSGEIDASIVTCHMMLELHALKLGSCWVLRFDPMKLRESFDIPEEEVIVNLLVAGKIGKDAAPSIRHSQSKELSELTKFY